MLAFKLNKVSYLCFFAVRRVGLWIVAKKRNAELLVLQQVSLPPPYTCVVNQKSLKNVAVVDCLHHRLEEHQQVQPALLPGFVENDHLVT